MTLEELRRNHRADILRIAETYGVTNIRVFGSVARGDAGPGSDVDLLVHPPKGIGIGFIRCELELSDRLHMPVQLISDNALHYLIRDNILAEAVPL